VKVLFQEFNRRRDKLECLKTKITTETPIENAMKEEEQVKWKRRA